MKEPEADSFWLREYAHYLGQHRHPMNRAAHFVGIPLLLGTAAAALVLRDWHLFVGGQLVGWALQLLGHRFEGNRPTLLTRPSGLLMGPLMVLVEMGERVGLHFGFAQRARAKLKSTASD